MPLPSLIHHQLATRANRIKRRLGKPPRWVYPISTEVYYRKILVAYVTKLREEFKRIVLPVIPRLVAQAQSLKSDSVNMDAWSADLDGAMTEFQESGDSIFPNSQMMQVLSTVGQRTDVFNREQWYKICKQVLGVDIYTSEPELTSRMEAFVHDNVALITDSKAQVYKDVRLTVSNGIRAGDRFETISDNILADSDLTRGVFSKVEIRARFIARDQVSKLNGDIASYRQQGAGVAEYYWRSVEDERVVGTPGGKYPFPTRGHGDHYKMDGALCRWNDANAYSMDGGKAWLPRPQNLKGAIPGSQYNCRCYGEPKFGKEFESVGSRS
jgi:uncharacterized protein with gpF-like domain